MKKLFIISNENIYENENEYFCDNLDFKSTPEGLNDNFEVNIIARKSKKIRSHKIEIGKIKLSRSIFSFLKEVIKNLNSENSKYLIISITPYTFLACIILGLFKKKPMVYLRSDGYGEYKAIFGFIGPIIYHFMFIITSVISNFISCRKYILRNQKGNIVSPSQLDESWSNNITNANFDKIKLLYIGRIKIEKGIYSLLNIIKNNDEISLSIVGAEKNSQQKIRQNNVSVNEIVNNKQKLIKYYDDHNIFVLPSFTEGHPMCLLEALARKRPVIIFNEIEHIIGDKKGIFVCDRNSSSLLKTIHQIKQNYLNIQNEMKKNNLPSKKKFIDDLSKIINNVSR